MSGTARLLERLQHGPATAAELYALHCIVHSRISELRKQGHRIVCTRTPGVSGPEAYVYQIVDGSLRERETDTPAAGCAPAGDLQAERTAGSSRSLSDPLTRSGPEPQSRNGGSDALSPHPSGSGSIPSALEQPESPVGSGCSSALEEHDLPLPGSAPGLSPLPPSEDEVLVAGAEQLSFMVAA